MSGPFRLYIHKYGSSVSLPPQFHVLICTRRQPEGLTAQPSVDAKTGAQLYSCFEGPEEVTKTVSLRLWMIVLARDFRDQLCK